MKKNKKFKLLFLALVLVIGIAYAYVTRTLKINGNNGISSNSWIIYFDKIENQSGVVSTETNITNNRQQVNFNINLKEPGDYYEFDVDTVNDGTIDAMIDSLEVDEIDGDLNNYLSFDVTYKDGTEINKCDLLEKHSRKTITVKVKFDEYVDEEELVTETSNLNLKFKINYVQKDVCDSYPTLVVDPNGGKYNGTRKLTKMKVNKNSDTVLDAPERNGYDFLYFETENGTQLAKDEENKTTVHVNNSDVKVIAQWEEQEVITKYILTIDPDGGLYDGKTTKTKVPLAYNEIYELEEPTKENYIFDSWQEITETYSLNDSTVTMPEEAVEVKAVWKTEADYVARIEHKYYTTIQKAFDAAVDGDKVWLLKSTTENATNVKNISFDLGGFTVTGTITNSGTLTIDNGKIENTESSPFVNTGTVNVGTHDGEMISDSIIIDAGRNVNGLTQNGIFNFYDGYIIGQTAVTGIYNELEEGYYYVVDGYDDKNTGEHWQKAYLTDELDAIVKKIIGGKDVYYKLLQDAVDQSSNDNPYIYAINNFKDGHETTIGENDIIVLDIAGFNVEEGAAIINNGTLTLKNTDTTKGSMGVREAIVNNGVLNIVDLSLSQLDNTNDKNLITNSGELNISNSTLTASTPYALVIKNGGDLVFDNTTSISGYKYGIYNESEDDVTITGGNIVGIYNNGSNLTVSNSRIDSTTNLNYEAALYNNKGKLYLNNLDVHAGTASYGVLTNGTSNLVQITGGTYTTTGTYYQVISSGSGALEISGATITGASSQGLIRNSATIELTNTTINATGNGLCIYNEGGTFTITSGTYTSQDRCISSYYYGTININGGTFTSKYVTITTHSVLNINNGTFTSSDSYAVDIEYGNTNITSGTFISETTASVYKNTNTSLNITGGTLKGKTYGLLLSQNSSGDNIIGTNDSTIGNTTPVFVGELFGMYIPAGKTLKFYDGIVYGKNDSYYGDVTATPNKYEMIKENKVLDGESYTASYLQPLKKFVEVDGVRYDSIQDAIDSITGSSGEIKVVETVTINESATFPTGKTITFDLNGNSITNSETLTNNSNLIIKDDSQNKTGLLYSNSGSYNYPLIKNNNKITIKSGNFKSLEYVISNYSSNTEINIEDGVFEGNRIITGNSTSKISISGGAFTSKYNHGAAVELYNDGIITGGTFTNNGESAAVCVYGNSTITGGTFYSKAGSGLYISGGFTTVSDVNVTSESGKALYVGSKTILNNVTATSTSSFAISIAGSSEVIVNSGTYTSINAASLNYSGTNTKILGGTFQGKTYGLNAYDSSELIIGSDDGNVTSNKPIFIGDTYGAYILNGRIQFYDGIFKGKSKAHDGIIDTLADGYIITYGTEGEYETATLAIQQPFLRVGSQDFSSLQEAIDAISTTGTIDVIGEGFVSKPATIGSSQNITLDLNGFTIYTSNSIVNNGELTLKDSSNPSEGLFYNNGKTAFIKNNGVLNVESGEYKSISGKNNTYVILQNGDNNSSTLITGGSFENKSIDVIYKSRGTLQIDDGNFNEENTSGYLVNTGGSGTTINGGTFTSTGNGLHVTSPFDINGGTITVGGTAISVEGSSAFNVFGGDITGTIGIYLNNSGNNKILGGTITGKGSYGIYSYYAAADIGTNDLNINTSIPVIEGKTYGVYSTRNLVNFYDGILKGQTHAYGGSEFNSFATNSTLNIDSETVDNVTKEIAYLVPLSDIIRNETTGVVYNDLQTAFTAATSGDNLTVVENIVSYNVVEVPNKTITLELDGHTISFLKTFTNEGNLTIVDNNSNNTGKLYENANNFINNNKLSLSKLDMEPIGEAYITLIQNNGELSISNSNLGKANILVDSKAGSTTTITDSNLHSLNVAVNNSGILSMTDTDIEAESGNAIVNYGKMTVSGGTYNNHYNGSSYPTVIYSNTTDSSITNKITGITTDSEYSIQNYGYNVEVRNSNLAGAVYNEGNSLDIINTNVISKNTKSLILNAGTMNITDKSATLNHSTVAIENTGTMNLNNFNIVNDASKNLGTIYGIQNSGTLNYNKGNIEFSNAETEYGINSINGTLKYLDGNIELNSKKTAYGVYVVNGAVTIGELENPLSVSTTNPSITAIGTTSGVGIYKTSGQVYYYDGKITGSTQAIPQALTDYPEHHRIILQSLPNDNNYDIRILEYVQ